MSILEAYRPYIDKYGLVQDKPGNTSGNGIRYSSEAVYVLLNNEHWDAESAQLIGQLGDELPVFTWGESVERLLEG